MAPEICPNCGAEVPRKAAACPECGADEKTGWSETAYAQRLDLPNDEFDYNEFVKNEFGPEKKRIQPPAVGWFWWAVALLLLLALLSLWVWR